MENEGDVQEAKPKTIEEILGGGMGGVIEFLNKKPGGKFADGELERLAGTTELLKEIGAARFPTPSEIKIKDVIEAHRQDMLEKYRAVNELEENNLKACIENPEDQNLIERGNQLRDEYWKADRIYKDAIEMTPGAIGKEKALEIIGMQKERARELAGFWISDKPEERNEEPSTIKYDGKRGGMLMLDRQGKFVDHGKRNIYASSVIIGLAAARDYMALAHLENTYRSQTAQAVSTSASKV